VICLINSSGDEAPFSIYAFVEETPGGELMFLLACPVVSLFNCLADDEFNSHV